MKRDYAQLKGVMWALRKAEENLTEQDKDVLIVLFGHHKVIIRRYEQLSASKNMPQFELLAPKPHWANIQDTVELECQLVGTLYGLNRILI